VHATVTEFLYCLCVQVICFVTYLTSDDKYVHLNVNTVLCIMNSSCKLDVSYAQVTVLCYSTYELCLYIECHAIVFDHQVQ
jgi:hypothetical protein